MNGAPKGSGPVVDVPWRARRGEVSGLYVHVPFCASDCAYCAFSREVPVGRRAVASYLDALEREVGSWLDAFGGPLEPRTLYVGGGTPTFLDAGEWERLACALGRLAGRDRMVEVTVEANPETIDAERLAALARFGITRLSIGAQSSHPEVLTLLDRRHDFAAVERAVRTARAVPGLAVSVDLIYGIPGLTPEAWARTLEDVLALDVDHLSAYCLSYEEGTSLAKRRANGSLAGQPDGEQRYAYDVLVARAERAGLSRYEVSNFGRPFARSAHNLTYWTRGSYLGLGPSAHSFVGEWRFWNHTRRPAWESALSSGDGPMAGGEKLGPADVIAEILMELRVADGLALDRLPSAGESFRRRVGVLEAEGLLEHAGGRLRLAAPGFFVSDGIIADLLGALEVDGESPEEARA